MKKESMFAILLVGLLIATTSTGCIKYEEEKKVSPLKDLTKYVNPFIGTSCFRGGHTSPGAQVPFGMTQWTPETQEYGPHDGFPPVPYYYLNSTISGFRGSHYPSGAWMGEYGCITIMPTTGDIETSSKKRSSAFSHMNEKAWPGYYSVFLDDYETKVELTATMHAGFLRFTPPSPCDNLNIIINTRKEGGHVKIIPETMEVVGYTKEHGRSITPDNFAGYFVAEFSKPFSSYGTWRDKEIHLGSKTAKTEKGHRGGAFVRFASRPSEVILMRVGTSFISIDQARQNLKSEIQEWDFDRVRREAKELWNKELNKIEVVGGTKDQRIIFYTALYHCLLLPRVFSEGNKYYSPFDGKTHEGVYYEDFSLWDTYRTEHPLLVLVEPERDSEMIRSLIQMYEEFGWMPKWPNPGYSNVMIGTHADSVIADAYLKGIIDFDAEKAYEAMHKNAMVPPSGSQAPMYCDTLLPPGGYEARGGLSYYKKMGYVPADVVKEAASRTLEFAYDDFCIAQMAKALGKREDYELFIKRARYYKNVFDSYTGFVRGKNSDGSWIEPFEPTEWYDYITEGTPWHYTWYVPQDVQGLIDLMGGKEPFIEKLDIFFEMGSKEGGPNFGKNAYYWHGNEPSQHIAYLYDYVGEPWKTQRWVKEIMGKSYGKGPAGLCGNDDAGQTSAWYVFSAMGFYPVCPGEPSYEIGSPIFDEVIIHLDREYYKGGRFVIKANNVSEINKYIQSATLNRKPLAKPWITHEDIANGGTLIFEMGPNPNKEWGSKSEQAPPSMTKRDK
jgi:predicted alpha-1,2-mannosidase